MCMHCSRASVLKQQKIASARHLLFSLCMTLLPACIFAQASNRAPAPCPLAVKSVGVDSRYDSLFLPQKRGFAGADGAASVKISDHRILWIFGDTVLGSTAAGKREGPMI